MNRNELAAHKTFLVELRERLIHDINTTEEAIRQDVLAPGEHAAGPTHPADQDVEGLHEQIAIAHNEERILEDVEAALARIEAGRFGACEDCRRPIGKPRLDAIPYTPRCIECARKFERQWTPGD